MATAALRDGQVCWAVGTGCAVRATVGCADDRSWRRLLSQVIAPSLPLALPLARSLSPSLALHVAPRPPGHPLHSPLSPYSLPSISSFLWWLVHTLGFACSWHWAVPQVLGGIRPWRERAQARHRTAVCRLQVRLVAPLGQEAKGSPPPPTHTHTPLLAPARRHPGDTKGIHKHTHAHTPRRTAASTQAHARGCLKMHSHVLRYSE